MTFDKSHFDALERLLEESLATLKTDLSAQGRNDVREYIQHGEYGVAYELLVFILDKQKLAYPHALIEAAKKIGIE